MTAFTALDNVNVGAGPHGAAPTRPGVAASSLERMTDNGAATGPATLLVSKDRARLHVTDCPHVEVAARATLVPATSEQVDTLPLCSSCRNILDGARRRTYPTLDAALEALPIPVQNRPRMRELAADLEYSYIWIPASGSYVAVSPEQGEAAVAYFNKGFVDIRVGDNDYDRHLMATYRGSARGTSATAAERPAQMCPTCFTQLPATGTCDTCG